MRPGEVDVAIAGGGPAGAAAGLALARAGLRVRLYEHDAARPFRVGEGLPPSARSLLRDLGVLDRMAADGHRPSPGTLAFWGSDRPHAEDALFGVHGQGWQLDRIRFDAMLREAAAVAGADVRTATLRLDAGGDARTPHRLVSRDALGGEARFEARWLIDASGRAATFARTLGAERIAHDRLFAFHLRLQSGGDTDRDGRTWVESVEDGWWYSVLLPSGERLIAFLCDADADARRRLLDGDGLWRHLAGASQLHALCVSHGWRPQGRAHGAEASSVELDRAAGERWLAVGDAALAFDPLSSKGISNALYTGLRAADTLLACERGDATATGAYARHQRDIHRVYREQLRAFHAMETRWPQSPFWQHRQAPAIAGVV